MKLIRLITATFFISVPGHSGELNDVLNQADQVEYFDNLTRSKVENNKVTILHLGQTSRPMRNKLMSESKNFIFVKMPYWYDDVSGRGTYEMFRDKLIENPGLDIRVTVDWFTAGQSHQLFNQTILEDLKNLLGPHYLIWNPISWQRDFSFAILKDRLHDKVLIVDGTKAIMGGMNIADKYLYGGETRESWHDTDILIEGPSVRTITRYFLKDWELSKAFKSDVYFPASNKARTLMLQDIYWNDIQTHTFRTLNGKTHVRSPKDRWDEHTVYLPFLDNYDQGIYNPKLTQEEMAYKTPVRVIYDNLVVDRDPKTGESISKISLAEKALYKMARKRIRTINPYPTFTKSKRAALITAAKRGVKVEMLINSQASNDLGSVIYLGGAHDILELLEAGIIIYEWRGHSDLFAIEKANDCMIDGDWPGHTLHTKGLSIDSQVVVLGSHNFNTRSELMNNEISVLINDEEYAQQFEDIFEFDLDKDTTARKISCGGKMYERPAKVNKLEIESFRDFVRQNKKKSGLLKHLKILM